MPFNFTEDQLLLVNLLLRIAVMASVISLVLGFKSSLDVLMNRTVSFWRHFRFGVILAIIFAIGVLARKHTYQGALDLSLEGTLLAGFLGGVWVGTLVGAVVGVVCYIFGEAVALPFYLIVGFTGGMIYTRLGGRREVWNYSMNPFMIFYNFLEALSKKMIDCHFIPFAICIVAAFTRYALINRFGSNMIYGLNPGFSLLGAVDLVSMVYTLGIALKIADNTKNEILLREEEDKLIKSRLITLRSQINPHFLFNTLNSISALIRTNSEKAREMTCKLSSIFRKSLQESTDIHTFAEEMDFVNDYLSIEKVRFGDERLRVVKDIDESTLDRRVPVMILQPLVENAIKHGISRCAEGGEVRISSRSEGEGVEVEIENDSPGLQSDDMERLFERGLGLKNVAERLQIYSEGKCEFSISQEEGGVVKVKLYIPGMSERRGLVGD
jgi:two-component system LytT family sensor kinase